MRLENSGGQGAQEMPLEPSLLVIVGGAVSRFRGSCQPCLELTGQGRHCLRIRGTAVAVSREPCKDMVSDKEPGQGAISGWTEWRKKEKIDEEAAKKGFTCEVNDRLGSKETWLEVTSEQVGSVSSCAEEWRNRN